MPTHASDPPRDLPQPGDRSAGTGPREHSDELITNLYTELRAIAAGYFASQPAGHTLQPTALVNEAVLRLMREGPGASGGGVGPPPGHFIAVAAKAMRHILIDYSRNKSALKRGGGDQTRLDAAGDRGGRHGWTCWS